MRGAHSRWCASHGEAMPHSRIHRYVFNLICCVRCSREDKHMSHVNLPRRG
jgi:hypothetical protein